MARMLMSRLTGRENFVSQLADELHIPENEPQALSVLKAVLHGIRNRITPTCSLHVMEQLPANVKTIYADGWKSDATRARAFEYDDFVTEVSKNCYGAPIRAVSNNADCEDAVYAVFKVLKKNLSYGEYSDMMAYLPISLRLHLTDYTMEGQSAIY